MRFAALATPEQDHDSVVVGTPEGLRLEREKADKGF
jgi:hypothetical protein